ncbi:hypothetical protein FA15DRAFT_343039 [Coprinopsis marcescibilis]|uniref:F-box domain-containing protein n=1 Tax=Coprinopsis marcescibilis TaxID=230819 RepID=A0A5C3L9X3_COPMA|nr:hypothetical protein FA15DRAFT_343039 [Coprinopsis marcescibilis]
MSYHYQYPGLQPGMYSGGHAYGHPQTHYYPTIESPWLPAPAPHSTQQLFRMDSQYVYPAQESGVQTPERIVQLTPRAARSAIGRIPCEIWMHIFRMCQSSNLELQRPSAHRAPLNLTHVCQGLRVIAQGDSNLWSTIVLTPGGSKHAFPHRRLLRLWLHLSANKRLTIILHAGDMKRVTPFDSSDELWADLSRVMDRWETLILWTGGGWNSPAISPFAAGHIPKNLKTIKLEGSVDIRCITPLITQLVASAPSLQSFGWQDKVGAERRFIPGFSQMINFGSRLLTRLELMNPIDVSELLHLLSRIPSLEECTIKNLLLPSGFVQAAELYLPRLRSLSLMTDLDSFDTRGQWGSILGNLLAKLAAPSLKNLSLGYDENWDQKTFEAFIHRSQCRLDSLAFEIISLSENDLLRTLALMSGTTHIKSLTVNTGEDDRTPMTKSVIQSLFPGPQCYCPSLQSVTVNKTTLTDSGGAFANMIQARCQSWPGPRQVRISGSFNQFGRVRSDLKTLRQLSRTGAIYLLLDQE